MVRGGHTQGGSRNTPSALLQDTSIPTHTLLVVRVVNHLTDWDPSPSPHSPPLPSTSYSPSPPPPLPSLATPLLSLLTLPLPIPLHLTILSQFIRELLIVFCQSQLEAPVSSNHQTRQAAGRGGGGGRSTLILNSIQSTQEESYKVVAPLGSTQVVPT